MSLVYIVRAFVFLYPQVSDKGKAHSLVTDAADAVTSASPHLHKTVKDHKTQIPSWDTENTESKVSGMKWKIML
jgi:hypothetical protein